MKIDDLLNVLERIHAVVYVCHYDITSLANGKKQLAMAQYHLLKRLFLCLEVTAFDKLDKSKS